MIKKAAILFVMLISAFCASHAAIGDTLAFLSVKNVFLRTPYAMEFEIHLQRNSYRWLKLANISMCFDFQDSSIAKNPEEFRVTRLDTTELPPLIVTGGGQLPAKGYDFKQGIQQNKLFASIIGPDEFNECVYVPKDTSILIAKYVVENVNKRLIDYKLTWKTPLGYYQASAYKLLTDSLYDGNLIVFTGDDNLELYDGSISMMAFMTDPMPQFNFFIDDFVVRYDGQRKVKYYWKTKSEFNCAGFTVRRAFVPDSNFKDITGPQTVVGTHQAGDIKFDQDFVSLGNSKIGHLYPEKLDTVEYRGGVYAYYLYYNPILKTGVGPDSLLAVRYVGIPNSVIVEATAMPNPFQKQTSISFKLDDDVYLTGVVRDLRGGEVTRLTGPDGAILNHRFMKKGTYTAPFDAPIQAAQGTYEAMLIAYPIDDPMVEISRAYVKLNYYKN